MTTLDQQMRAVHGARRDLDHEIARSTDLDQETKNELMERSAALLDAAETLSTLKVFGKFLENILGGSK